MKQRSMSAVLATLALFLTACGGGSGGASDDGLTPPSEPITPSLSEAIMSAAPNAQLPARQAATALPNFGSVTQSTNQDTARISTDEASTEFSTDAAPRLQTTIRRLNDSPITLDTLEHEAGDASVETSVLAPDRRFGRSTVGKSDASALTLGLMIVDWSTSNPTEDYLALGYWLHATGDIEEGRIDGVEIGAFVDGPELDNPADLPASGTATYTGHASGLYAVGPDTSSPELGTFTGDIILNAGFGTQRISGTVNHMQVALIEDGGLDDFDDIGHEIHLGPTPFDAGGFRGRDVTIHHQGSPLPSEGSWGGRFSTTADPAGNPRLVAGTLGGTTTRTGDAESLSFAGAFYGATGDFE